MENTNSLSKQNAVDGQGAFAGNAEPSPEQDTIDAVAAQAGIDLSSSNPTSIKSALDKRDRKRWELDPDSATSEHPQV